MKFIGISIFIILYSLTDSFGQKIYHATGQPNKKARSLWVSGKNAFDRYNDSEALKLWNKALSTDPEFTQVRLDLGALHMRRMEYSEALNMFEISLKNHNDLPPQIYYSRGVCLWELDQFSEAYLNFKQILDMSLIPERMVNKAAKYLRDSKFTLDYKFECEHEIHKMNPDINTDFPEYLPVLSPDMNTLYFTRRIQQKEDFYKSQRQPDGEWSVPILDEWWNTQLNEGAISFSADGNTAIYTRCGIKENIGECDLYESVWDGQVWSKPRNLGSLINSEFWDSQPSLSADGRFLFFVSNRHGGFGGKDIWYTQKDNKGHWNAPQNAGPIINTILDEVTPFIHPDGLNLYFSSEGHAGFGGLDVFRSKMYDNNWSNPENIGRQINTKKDESCLTVAFDGKTAHYSQIYPDPETKSMVADLYEVELCSAFSSKPLRWLVIKTYNNKDSTPIAPLIEAVQLSPLQSRGLYKSRKYNQVLLSLPEDESIGLHFYHPGYLFHSEHIEANKKNLYDTVNVYMIPIDKVETISSAPTVLKNVFFETASATLKSDSKYELDKLVQFLLQNPDIRIQINGHTDNVGTSAYNNQLSEMRALEVLNYLVEKGISKNRLASKGFGQDQPIATNETEEGRAQNRRTEFVVF
jgi:OmpA-OmpF porin, OOP family